LVDERLAKEMMTFMYKHSRDKRRPMVYVATFIASLVVVLAIISASLMIASTPGAAWDGPKIVRGKVTDSLGVPVAGVLVTVVIKDAGDGHTKGTLTDTTNSTGDYSVTFGYTVGVAGDTIDVTATLDPDTAHVAVVSDAEAIQYVNLQFGTVIPEFPGLVSVLAVVGILSMVIVMRGSRRR
jgi:hypothetical protein